MSWIVSGRFFYTLDVSENSCAESLKWSDQPAERRNPTMYFNAFLKEMNYNSHNTYEPTSLTQLFPSSQWEKLFGVQEYSIHPATYPSTRL